MKNLILAAFVAAFSLSVATAQTVVKKDPAGNYIAAGARSGGKLTGKYFIDRKGKKFPVWESSRGKLYYYDIATKGQSKGDTVKRYLKES